MSEPIRERILDAAEARARAGGYHGFSFRELAADVGIKSASIHYHFPTKADLAIALVQRYAERIDARLGDPADLSFPEAVNRVIGVFREALVRDDRMCLCGLFGAELDALPPEVATATRGFFARLLDYLERAKGTKVEHSSAASVLARLEGGLILARTMRERDLFEQALRTT